MCNVEKKVIEHVRVLLQKNKKVEAVKYVKEHLNLGLKESKDYVEGLQDGVMIRPLQVPSSEDLPSNINAYHKIQINHNTAEIYLLTDQGHKVEIDENHVLWNDAMQKFARKSYANKKEYLNALNQQNQSLQSQKIEYAPEKRNEVLGVEKTTSSLKTLFLLTFLISIFIFIIFKLF